MDNITTIVYFLLVHKIAHEPKMNTYPEVDLLSFGDPNELESVNMQFVLDNLLQLYFRG